MMLVEKYESYEIMPFSKRFKQLALLLCNKNSSTQDVCLVVICFLIGCNRENQKYFPFVLSNLPAGASVKQLVHYRQLQEEVFQKYDHGKEKNLKIYNSEQPPIYNLSNIRVKTALFFGTDDVLAAYQDVEVLATKLPKIIYKKKIKGYNHVDLIYGTDINNLVNTDIVNLLKLH